MADFDYMTRMNIRSRLSDNLKKRIEKLHGQDKKLAEEISQYNGNGNQVGQIIQEFRAQEDRKPSQWFEEHGAGLLEAFVPTEYQESYLYIIDKLNQFPFSSGWQRRTVRTRGYYAQIDQVFYLLNVYEKLFYCGESLEDLIYRCLDAEKMDYVRNEWCYTQSFSMIYAAEIDRGNQSVINALRDLILSENNTAYLDREMILGILCSNNRELRKLVCDLLLAARLQEGLRQAICEVMDEGTEEAFMELLQVIEDNNLIRYSSVKRAVSTWIGIFDEKSVDRVNEKLLRLMGQCLRDKEFCRGQLETNDSIAISVALWALGFSEASDAVIAMAELIAHGTKNQKLTVSYYNRNLFNTSLKIRTAKKVIMEHSDDLELVAAFMPAFNTQLSDWIAKLLYADSAHRMDLEVPQKPVLTDYFQERSEAERQYDKFWDIYERLPRKGVVYDPCIFPWYRVEMKPSEIVRQLAFLAYVLEDEEKKTKAAELLGEVQSDGYGSERASLLNLLLYSPANKVQRKLLINYMGNAEEATSSRAIAMVKRLTLQKEDYRQMEDMLRFKRSRLRKELLDFLTFQEDGDMEECLQRLLKDKNEEKRTAGLDLILRLSKENGKAELYSRVCVLAAEIPNPTDKEKVLLEEILGKNRKTVSTQEGWYGIYHPDAPEQIPAQDEGTDALAQCMSLSEQEIIDKLRKLDALIRENKDYEYETAFGEKQLLGNGYILRKFGQEGTEDGRYGSHHLKHFPLERELREFYEKEIGSYSVFIQIEARFYLGSDEINRNEDAQLFYKAVLGRYPFRPLPLNLEYARQVQGVLGNYRYEFLDKAFLFKAGIQAAVALGRVINRENKKIVYHYTGWNGQTHEQSVLVGSLRFINRFLEGLGYWETDEEFTKAFYVAWDFELKCAEKRQKSQFHSEVPRYDHLSARTITPITPYWFLKAYHMGLVSMDIVYKAVLNYFDRGNCLRAITQLAKGEYSRSMNRQLWSYFFGDPMAGKVLEQGETLVGSDTWCGHIIQELYDALIPVIVDTELRRGESETEFSEEIREVTYISGTEYLVRILMALGNDTLGRETYWQRSQGTTRKAALCHLLGASYPAADDNGEILRQRIKGTNIKIDRLVEVAMYAPQWIDMIEDYLGWKGLKSGCYYFMAHMDEYFSDQKEAMIARYTPLTPEELRGGAFDIDWFNEVYEMLGEKNFSLLYKAAKYISDGQKHARARKYADAASGKVTLKELREQITAKRNKDLLMSYGLVPFAKDQDNDQDKDMLERYHFIQQYAKEAKQFGAQRRASETIAAQTALVNLSVHAGFSDVTRLILKMESCLAQEFASYMEWCAVEDVEICLHVDETGKSAVLCRKDEKMLKSVPTRLKNNKYVMEVKDANKKLKEQYSRAKKMMEESMESGEEFTAAEVIGLLENAVVSAIIKPLLFLSEEQMGFLEYETAAGLALRAWDGTKKCLENGDKMRIVHPLDLYRAGVWHDYQKYLFDSQIRQPFKQIFRELYVKMPEELGMKASRMFAGNQIQPHKTVACLKGRRWVADFEEGLQKIYYKENIVARIYALADWFSPSDAESPTLEWVEFSNRKTFEALTIEEVPDLIYSEVMRDVDLAVSVAHAGGVDPVTSHSTVEMRRAIIAFNLPLFQINNVVLKDSHALIKGTRGNYNVHLGSGVVHQEGGAMLNILPVHSQKRGKLFLPFVDEDPKTAEIMSKIVLLAEDRKIRDPYILDQIRV